MQYFLKMFVILRGISSTFSAVCETVANVINCDYSKRISLLERILIFVQILETFFSFQTEKLILAHASLFL
jgi:hypothetical protein